MEGMLIVAPVILLLLGFWLFSGSASMLVLLPIVVTAGAGAFVIARVLREGRRPPDRSVRQLPSGHLQRQMYLALRPRRAKGPDRGDTKDD